MSTPDTAPTHGGTSNYLPKQAAYHGSRKKPQIQMRRSRKTRLINTAPGLQVACNRRRRETPYDLRTEPILTSLVGCFRVLTASAIPRASPGKWQAPVTLKALW